MAKKKSETAPKKSVKKQVNTEPELTRYVLTKVEEDALLDALLHTETLVKRGLKSIGVYIDVAEESLSKVTLQIERCTRCNLWYVLSDLDYEGYCEDCTSELNESDMRGDYQDNDSYYD